MYEDCVCVMVAINDGPPAGACNNRLGGIVLGDEVLGDYLSLDSYEEPSRVRCKVHKAMLEMGRPAPRVWQTPAQFAILGHIRHVGNLVWDAVFVTPEVAAEIANFVRKMKTATGKEWAFSFDSGTDRLTKKWDSFEPFTAEDFEGAKGFHP